MAYTIHRFNEFGEPISYDTLLHSLYHTICYTVTSQCACLGCSVCRKSPTDTTICNSNSRGFLSAMRMTSLNILTQSCSRNPGKGPPTIVKSNRRFVTSLDPGVVPRSLISWRTAFCAFRGAQYLITVPRENTRRFGILLRFKNPESESR